MFLSGAARTILFLALVAAAGGASAVETLPGPYRADLERVVDGDTIAARVTVWLQHDISVLVRVRGIDAPERRGSCDGERLRAAAAAAALRRMLADGQVLLTEIAGDKFFGRIVADVTTEAGEDVAERLMAAGHARPYDGGVRASWCDAEAGDALAQVVE